MTDKTAAEMLREALKGAKRPIFGYGQTWRDAVELQQAPARDLLFNCADEIIAVVEAAESTTDYITKVQRDMATEALTDALDALDKAARDV